MIKKAYKKLFFYPLWRYTLAVIISSALLYNFILYSGTSYELVRIFRFICVGSGSLITAMALCTVIRYVAQVQRANRYLHTFPEYIRERLEQELEMENRMGDLYFTDRFLLVYQLRLGKKQGFACIPYADIGSLRISADKQYLEILAPDRTVSHRIVFSHELEIDEVKNIQQKILSLQAKTQYDGIRAEVQNQRKHSVKSSLYGSIVLMFVLNFATIMVFCGTMGAAEKYRKSLKFAEKIYTYENAEVLFWPNFLFYTAMYGSILILAISSIWFARKKLNAKDKSIYERKIGWQILVFTIGVILFILFIGSMYTSDVHTWENMIQGFWMLF